MNLIIAIVEIIEITIVLSIFTEEILQAGSIR